MSVGSASCAVLVTPDGVLAVECVRCGERVWTGGSGFSGMQPLVDRAQEHACEGQPGVPAGTQVDGSGVAELVGQAAASVTGIGASSAAGDVAGAFAGLVTARAQLDRIERLLVVDGLRGRLRYSWEQVGEFLGVSRQAAHKRYRAP